MMMNNLPIECLTNLAWHISSARHTHILLFVLFCCRFAVDVVAAVDVVNNRYWHSLFYSFFPLFFFFYIYIYITIEVFIHPSFSLFLPLFFSINECSRWLYSCVMYVHMHNLRVWFLLFQLSIYIYYLLYINIYFIIIMFFSIGVLSVMIMAFVAFYRIRLVVDNCLLLCVCMCPFIQFTHQYSLNDNEFQLLWFFWMWFIPFSNLYKKNSFI